LIYRLFQLTKIGNQINPGKFSSETGTKYGTEFLGSGYFGSVFDSRLNLPSLLVGSLISTDGVESVHEPAPVHAYFRFRLGPAPRAQAHRVQPVHLTFSGEHSSEQAKVQAWPARKPPPLSSPSPAPQGTGPPRRRHCRGPQLSNCLMC
jgi:hypothetical protein